MGPGAQVHPQVAVRREEEGEAGPAGQYGH